MTQTGGNFLIGSRDQYLQGAAALRNGRDVTMEWRDQFILAANEGATHLNAETSTLESPSYNGVSNSTDAYPVEESQTLVDELAANLFYPIEAACLGTVTFGIQLVLSPIAQPHISST
jgi:hypothetical protein